MKNKRFCVILMLAAMLFMTSCDGAKGKSDNTESYALTIMGRKSDMEKSYMTSIFEQYETAYKKKLKIIAIEDDEFEKDASKFLMCLCTLIMRI